MRVVFAASLSLSFLLALTQTTPAAAEAGPGPAASSPPKGTGDGPADGRERRVYSMALAAVAIGATTVGLALPNSAHDENRQQATAALAGFMQKQHAPLTHDLALAGGPVLDAWSDELGLDRKEREALLRALEGSFEQGNLLEALDGPIDGAQAQRFAGAFVRVANRALGARRTNALVYRAILATGV